MSLNNIKLIPTASGIAAASAAVTGGFSLQGKYIGFGVGHQQISVNENNEATTEQLKSPIEWLEILSAQEVASGQWLLAVDAKDTNKGVEFELTEVALSTAETLETANDHIIAIYGHNSQKIATVAPQISHFEIGVYVNLTAMPVDSIEIVHGDLPTDIFSINQMAALYLHQLALDDALFTQRETINNLQAQLTAQTEQ